ncbi:MAG: hypothetical protein JWN25_1565 [Verrucomicrobiales bacterium]|nr:hypothetical protein [Verrucomicrobiales bacterium]
MNYLAHAFLSNQNAAHLVGNFMADHWRGNNFQNLPMEVVEGIRLHRKIDSFTDSHREFKKSKRVFYSGFEKYSGILVDIYFDHLLARQFLRYSSTSLEVFSEKAYSIYLEHREILPESGAEFLDHVVMNNLYEAYAKLENVELALKRLSLRTKHGVQLENSLRLFTEKETELVRNFEVFFEEAMQLFMPATRSS